MAYVALLWVTPNKKIKKNYPLKRLFYRSYKHIDTGKFLSELDYLLSEGNICLYSDFEYVLKSLVDKYAPLKTKILRGNNSPHMSKDLRKAIMKRSRLKSLAIRTNKNDDWANYKVQRNLVVNLNKKAKKSLFENVGEVSGQKKFLENL